MDTEMFGFRELTEITFRNFMIHVIATSANIEQMHTERKKQYLKGLTSIVYHYEVNPFIIETVTKTDYLNEHFTGNSTHSTNKGINELINIDLFFKQYANKFHPQDHIVKTTLRYEITGSYLVDCIKKDEYDVYCKSSKDIYGLHDQGIHTFLFSMRYYQWQEFLDKYFDKSVGPDDLVERQLANYVKIKNTSYLHRLDMLASPWNLKKTFSV